MLKRIVLVCGVLAYGGAAYAANPSIKTTWKYYDIEGATSKELKKQMRRKGPRGYWAYARWFVNWTSRCQVTVKIQYTMPRWKNPEGGSADLRVSWNKMIANLKEHEQGHGKHGIEAGKEVAANNCKSGTNITRKWAKQDKIFDRKTSHGRKTGVILP